VVWRVEATGGGEGGQNSRRRGATADGGRTGSGDGEAAASTEGRRASRRSTCGWIGVIFCGGGGLDGGEAGVAAGRKARRPQRTTGWMACTWVPPVRGAGMKGESTRRARGDRRMEMDGAGGVPRMVTIRVLRAHWLRRAASLSPSPGLPPIYEEAEAQSCRFALLSSVVANKGGWPLEGSDPLPFLFVPST
jgi:hypothetical protein